METQVKTDRSGTRIVMRYQRFVRAAAGCSTSPKTFDDKFTGEPDHFKSLRGGNIVVVSWYRNSHSFVGTTALSGFYHRHEFRHFETQEGLPGPLTISTLTTMNVFAHTREDLHDW